MMFELTAFKSSFLNRDGNLYQYKGGLMNLKDENFSDGKVPELYNIVSISHSRSHVLCLRNDGRVFSFGAFTQGQLGRDIITDQRRGAVPPFIFEKWGKKEIRFLADNLIRYKPKYWDHPRMVNINENVIDISCSEFHSLFLTDDGCVYASGWNHFGVMPGQPRVRFYSPVKLTLPFQVMNVFARRTYSVFITPCLDIYYIGFIRDSETPRVTENNCNIPCGVNTDILPDPREYPDNKSFDVEGTYNDVKYYGVNAVFSEKIPSVIHRRPVTELIKMDCKATIKLRCEDTSILPNGINEYAVYYDGFVKI